MWPVYFVVQKKTKVECKPHRNSFPYFFLMFIVWGFCFAIEDSLRKKKYY